MQFGSKIRWRSCDITLPCLLLICPKVSWVILVSVCQCPASCTLYVQDGWPSHFWKFECQEGNGSAKSLLTANPAGKDHFPLGHFSSDNYATMRGKQLVRFICRHHLILLNCSAGDRANGPGTTFGYDRQTQGGGGTEELRNTST